MANAFLRFFAPAPPAAVMLTDAAEIKARFGQFRQRVLISSIIGYATFYLVRKNLSAAMPVMETDIGISKEGLGLFLTLHGVLYGISKFANGFLGDRSNAAAMMATGLIASALMNVCFGISSAVMTLGIFWMLNGWFQGMGFPPCARLLTHWFSPKQLATRMSIWNTSHCIGGGIILVLGTQLAVINWRLCFFVPAAIAAVCAFYILYRLPDTPPSVGLPEAEGTHNPTAHKAGEDFWPVLVKYVFTNKYIWLLSLANFFVYVLRYAVLDWGPTLLTQAKHIHLTNAGWMVFAFEIAGLFGALVGGWIAEKYFAGRCLRACVFFMALAGVSMWMFWRLGGDSKLVNTLLLCLAGFCIYGPQCLIGIAAANLATKQAAASSVGLTGLFGYASTVVSGWGLGWLVTKHGWDAGFKMLIGVAIIGTVLFALGWRAKAHGYAETPEKL